MDIRNTPVAKWVLNKLAQKITLTDEQKVAIYEEFINALSHSYIMRGEKNALNPKGLVLSAHSVNTVGEWICMFQPPKPWALPEKFDEMSYWYTLHNRLTHVN